MKFFDKNYDELYVGADVSVPTPTTEDLWNFDFSGTILSFDKENNYCIVEDGDGDCWAVEPEKYFINNLFLYFILLRIF